MRTLSALFLILGCALGCSAQPPGTTSPASSPSSSRPAEPSPTATLSVVPDSTSMPMPVKVPWSVLARNPRTVEARTIKSDGRFRVTASESDPGTVSRQVIRVTDADGRVVVERRGAAPGAFVQDYWLSGQNLVVEEINEGARTVRLQVYDLTTGREIRLPGRARPTQPEIDASGGRIAFITGFARTRMCVVLVDLHRRTSTVTGCAEHEAVLGDVALGEDRVIYSSVVNPETKQRCKQIKSMVFGRAPVTISVTDPCLGWSGAVAAGVVAWDEADPMSGGLAFGAGFVRRPDGKVAELGAMDTDTIVGCGGMFFWEVADGRGARIDRWNRSGRVDTVLGPSESLVPVGMDCTENRWLSVRTDQIGSMDDQLTNLLLDARRS